MSGLILGLMVLGIAPAWAVGVGDLCKEVPAEFRHDAAASLSESYVNRALENPMSYFVDPTVCGAIRKYLAKCVPAEAKACFAPMDTYLTLHCQWPGHAMGYTLSDPEYYVQVRARLGDEAVSVPKDLETAYLSQSDMSEALKSIVSQHAADGWKGLEYYSSTVANPPNGSHRRYLVLVPGPKFDRWIQFTLPVPGAKKKQAPEREIAYQVVEKDSAGKAQSTYFREFWRDGDQAPFQMHEKAFPTPKSHHVGDRCMGCHSSGLRQIDLSVSKGKFDLAEGAAFNELMAGYGKLSLGPKSWFDPSANGPPMGKSGSLDESCLKDFPQARAGKIKNAIACASCHGEKGVRGKLSAGTVPFALHFKILDASAPMPPDGMREGLNDEEKKALYPCLVQTYAGQLKTWLNGDPRCQSASFSTGADSGSEVPAN